MTLPVSTQSATPAPQDSEHDLVVIGGGLAGVCAAIAAARQGLRVALVQNRPVLGGNSSSEVRVWVCGATAHGTQRFARETGIMGELFVENQFTNPEGNPYYWDLVLLEAVRAEPLIELFLNTEVTEVVATGDDDVPGGRRIHSVTGWMSGSERRIRFNAPQFADCSGDGLIGHLAGADHRTGREARAVHGESWAVPEADDATLGSTILFYSKDTGRPSKFVPPSFAVDLAQTSIPEHRVIKVENNGCAYWWIEWGGELDVVADNERIRDELQAVVYGIWDWIKNSGRFDADTLTLEWIGSVPGKREYRRFVGEHVLTQHDILGQTEFDDRIGFGGWSIDLHPPGGVYATEHGSRHWHPDGPYHLPLRSYFSRNVANLWMAGRSMSASHVAFGSTRVMATCALGGEAVGIGAGLVAKLDATALELATDRVDDLRHALVRADASVLGVAGDDPADLVLESSVTASSTLAAIRHETTDDSLALDEDLAVLLPVHPRLTGLEVLIDVDHDTTLLATAHRTSKPQNYLPDEEVDRVEVEVVAGEKQWVALGLEWSPAEPANVLVVLHATDGIRVRVGPEHTPGVVVQRHRKPDPTERWTEQWRAWKQVLQRRGVCLRMHGTTDAYAAERTVGGYARPYGGPQMWVSQPFETDPEPTLEYRWAQPVTGRELQIILDDDVDEDLINLHHHRTPFDVIPEIAREIEVSGYLAGTWRVLAEVTDQRHRRLRIPFDPPVQLEALRVRIRASNGADSAHVQSVRLYRD